MMYFRKNKGPFSNGITAGEKYSQQKAEVLKLIQAANGGDPTALKEVQKEATRWKQMLGNPGAPPALVTRDIGPSLADVQGVPLLKNMSVAYANDDYIGRTLFPTVPTDQITGSYTVYDERPRHQTPATKGGGAGGSRAQANEVKSPKSKDNYNCEPDTLMSHTAFDVVLNAESPPLNEMLDLVESVNNDLELKVDTRLAGVATTAGNYPTGNKVTLTAGIRWDEAGGDPRRDINTAKSALWRGNGTSMLVAWTSQDIWDILKTNGQLLDMLSANDRGMISPQQFLEIFELDALLVSEARSDSANIGQTASYGRIWGNYFGLARVSETPQLKNASFGVNFRWTPQGLPGGVWSQQWYDPREGALGSFYYKRSHYEDPVILAGKTGYLITTPTTP
jgi:hypothetical protein